MKQCPKCKSGYYPRDLYKGYICPMCGNNVKPKQEVAFRRSLRRKSHGGFTHAHFSHEAMASKEW